MTTLTITAKGQITLNKALLRRMGVGPGDKLIVAETSDGGFIARPVASPGRRTIEGLIGALRRTNQKAVTVDEMNDAIAQSVADDDARIVAEVRARRS